MAAFQKLTHGTITRNQSLHHACYLGRSGLDPNGKLGIALAPPGGDNWTWTFTRNILTTKQKKTTMCPHPQDLLVHAVRCSDHPVWGQHRGPTRVPGAQGDTGLPRPTTRGCSLSTDYPGSQGPCSTFCQWRKVRQKERGVRAVLILREYSQEPNPRTNEAVLTYP